MEHSSRIDGRPSFQFYPDDWQSSTDVRMCSLAARGLWIEMLCIMWKANPRGMLKANGKQIEANTLAKLVASSKQDIRLALRELEVSGVFSRDADGTIYSRRMKRDWDLSMIRAEAGRRGGLASKKKAKSSPSSSTSSPASTSSSGGGEEKPTPPVVLHPDTQRFCAILRKNVDITPWFDAKVNVAFLAGVSVEGAVHYAKANPALVFDPEDFTKGLISAHKGGSLRTVT